jgi:putative membrane protein
VSDTVPSGPGRAAGGEAPQSPDALLCDDSGVELASNRTSLSFTRTRMAADRTLMATLRTSLALISFGFTIDQAFHQLHRSLGKFGDVPARNFGLGLIVIGLAMLTMGVAGHMSLGRQLTQRRERLFHMGLLRTDLRYGATPTLVASILLLVIGVAAAIGIVIRMRLST